MTDKELAELEALKAARNEAYRAYRAEASEANRLARNEAARIYQKRRIAIDPEFAKTRAEDSRRHYHYLKDEKASS